MKGRDKQCWQGPNLAGAEDRDEFSVRGRMDFQADPIELPAALSGDTFTRARDAFAGKPWLPGRSAVEHSTRRIVF